MVCWIRSGCAQKLRVESGMEMRTRTDRRNGKLDFDVKATN